MAIQLPWGQSGPALTVAASPLVSPWIEAVGFSQVVPFFAFAAGTQAHSIEGSWDGVSADADFNYAAPVSGTPFTIISPYFRWKTVQTVADATKSKVLLRPRP